MAETGEVVHWIAGLADADPLTRKVSALRIHLAGALLCTVVSNEWIKDPEFRELVRPFAINTEGEPSADQTPFVVGIAVRPDTFERIRSANGSPHLANVPPDQDAMEFEFRFDGHNDFDVLTTRDPRGSGAIAKYLEKFGEGIQQIEISVTDVDRATEILRARFGLRPVYPATRAGADGTRVNFFLAPAPQGKKVLIELVEKR